MTAVRGQLARLAKVVSELPPTAAAVRKARRLSGRAAWRRWYDALTVEDVQRLELVLAARAQPGETFRGVTVGSLRTGLAECGLVECRQFLARCAARGGGPPDVCGEASEAEAALWDDWYAGSVTPEDIEAVRALLGVADRDVGHAERAGLRGEGEP